jgi:hypothetical protein
MKRTLTPLLIAFGMLVACCAGCSTQREAGSNHFKPLGPTSNSTEAVSNDNSSASFGKIYGDVRNNSNDSEAETNDNQSSSFGHAEGTLNVTANDNEAVTNDNSALGFSGERSSMNISTKEH